MAVDFGLGSSLKYGCASTSLAEGLCAGFREEREVRSRVPALVRKREFGADDGAGGLIWSIAGEAERAGVGETLKPGQMLSVGMPQNSKIRIQRSRFSTARTILNGAVCLGKELALILLTIDPIRFYPARKAPSSMTFRKYSPHSTYRPLPRTSRHPIRALARGTTALPSAVSRWRIAFVLRHAEISHLHLSAILHEQITGLQIPMHNPIPVQVFHRGGKLHK